MTDEIPMSEKSKKDAKSREETRAQKQAHDKVKNRVEGEKTKPTREHVDTTPDADPQH